MLRHALRFVDVPSIIDIENSSLRYMLPPAGAGVTPLTRRCGAVTLGYCRRSFES